MFRKFSIGENMRWTRYRCGAEINVDSIIEVLTKEGNLTRDKFAKLMCSYASSDRRDYDITGPIKSSHWKKRVSFWDNNYGFSDENLSQKFWWFFFYLEKNRGSKFIVNPNFPFLIINFFANCLCLYSKLPFSHHWIITFLCTMKCWWNCFQEFKSKYKNQFKTTVAY